METIAQIATPIGEGGISIIKVSGDNSISVVNNIFKGFKDLNTVLSHSLNYGHIYDGENKIDEVLVGVMKAPNTYTGEDVVEINCHGGLLITNRILKLLLNNNVKLAPPGEFTKRAFLNGKKTIDEAENIMDLIHAKSEEALDIAINTLNNSPLNLIEDLREQLLKIVTNIEVNIDYPEYEDLEIIKNKDILDQMDKLIIDISEIIRDSNSGEIIKKGIQTAIIGKPNVGKSSLLNYLSKNDKAIVTNIEGTTRDIIENEIKLDNLTLNLIDTAGIRETDDVVEQIGVKKSIEQITSSQLILFVLDNSSKLSEYEYEIYSKIKDSSKPFIIIINKDDQQNVLDLSKLDLPKDNIIRISSIQKYGDKKLSKKINEIFNLQYFDASNSKYISNFEHINSLENIKETLLKIESDLKEEMFLDLILIDLKEVLFTLSNMLGLEVQDDYLNEIFSRFCLGK